MSFEIQWKYAHGHPWSRYSGVGVFSTHATAGAALREIITSGRAMGVRTHDYRIVQNRIAWDGSVEEVRVIETFLDEPDGPRRTAWERLLGDD